MGDGRDDPVEAPLKRRHIIEQDSGGTSSLPELTDTGVLASSGGARSRAYFVCATAWGNPGSDFP